MSGFPAWLRGWLVIAVCAMVACSAAPVPAPSVSASTSRVPAAAGSLISADPTGAAAALARLATAPAATMAGYRRDQFGQKWSDDVDTALGHNGCDTRNDILHRDLRAVTLKPGTNDCVVVAGTLDDPYTGASIPFVRGAGTSEDVQIDHVVALAAGWRTGAQLLTPERRQDFANDPLELLAVVGAANQDKGDDDAGEWLPAAPYRCAYVARQIAVKTRYALWVTDTERSAMVAVLDTCPDQPLPTG